MFLAQETPLLLPQQQGFPPTISIPCSISKTALKALTLEFAKSEIAGMPKSDAPRNPVRFYVISPGHCKTAFNGYRGPRNPLDGAGVIVELANAREKEQYGMYGFWSMADGGSGAKHVPW